MNAAAKHFDQPSTVRLDVYTRVAARIIADLEKGVRTWMKPWSGSNAEGRITLPLRHCGTPYRGINILLLWGTLQFVNPLKN
jgi:antirestriction protein ArdC